jgi:plastocyanin
MHERADHRTLATLVGFLAALSLAVSLAAAGSVRAATHAVAIRDFAFEPATLTITVGDTVTWTNEDSVAHTATSSTGAFDTGLLDQGESGSVTFTAAGTYGYFCEPHPSMTGQIVVQAAAAPPPAAPTPAPSAGGEELPDVATEPLRAGPISTGVLAGVILLIGAIGLAVLARRRTI